MITIRELAAAFQPLFCELAFIGRVVYPPTFPLLMRQRACANNVHSLFRGDLARREMLKQNATSISPLQPSVIYCSHPNLSYHHPARCQRRRPTPTPQNPNALRSERTDNSRSETSRSKSSVSTASGFSQSEAGSGVRISANGEICSGTPRGV